MFGLTAEEACPAAELWPDNLTTVNTFLSMSTQWRAGGVGLVGMDYNALPTVLRLSKVPRSEWSEVFNGIAIMESAALQEMRKKK